MPRGSFNVGLVPSLLWIHRKLGVAWNATNITAGSTVRPDYPMIKDIRELLSP
jgi:hypothetical protein